MVSDPIFQIVFGWTDEFSYKFRIYAKDYGIPGWCGISSDANNCKIDDFKFDAGDKFTYEYNFFKFYRCDVRIEGINSQSDAALPPKCVNGKGMPGATKFDEYEKVNAIAADVIKYRHRITINDVHCLLAELDSVRFNRQKCNQNLAVLDSNNPSFETIIHIGCAWRHTHEIQNTDDY